MAFVSGILHLPPLAILVQHSLIMGLTANSSGYCSTQLLADPLTQQRLGAAWHVLDAVLPVIVPVDFTGDLIPDGVQLTGARCDARPLWQGVVSRTRRYCTLRLVSSLATPSHKHPRACPTLFGCRGLAARDAVPVSA